MYMLIYLDPDSRKVERKEFETIQQARRFARDNNIPSCDCRLLDNFTGIYLDIKIKEDRQ